MYTQFQSEGIKDKLNTRALQLNTFIITLHPRVPIRSHLLRGLAGTGERNAKRCS
jgi:hypothetical protein